MSMYSYNRSSHYTTYRKIARAIKQAAPNRSQVYLTSTTGGGHATHSLHYLGLANDWGSKSQKAKDQLAAWLYPLSKYFNELIHTKASGGGFYVKNGRKVRGSFYGPTIVRNHINHVHIGMTEAGYRAMIKDPYFKKYLTVAHGRLAINLDAIDDTAPDESQIENVTPEQVAEEGDTPAYTAEYESEVPDEPLEIEEDDNEEIDAELEQSILEYLSEQAKHVADNG